MKEDNLEIKVHHQFFQGMMRKYLRTFVLLLITLLLLYFLQGIGTFSIFLSFILIFAFYFILRGNWLFEVNERGIISGSFNRREEISWNSLQFIIIELEREQIYLRSGEFSRLVNFQLISITEVELVKKALHHYAEKNGIAIEEKRGLKKG